MAIYDVKRLLTATDCDAALKKVSNAISRLEYKTKMLERRLDAHRRIASKATTQRSILEMDVAVFSAGLAVAGAEPLAGNYRYKITRAQIRIQLLNLRLQKYSVPALLVKTLKLRRAAAALAELEAVKAALEAHRATLLPSIEAVLPVTAQEPAQLIPFRTAPDPEQALKTQAIGRLVQRFLRRRKGKR